MNHNDRTAINPKDAKAYNNHGIAKYELGSYQNAIADYDRVIAINPKLDRVYNNRGFAKANLYDYQDAITDYDKAVALDPKDAIAYCKRCSPYNSKSNYA